MWRCLPSVSGILKIPSQAFVKCYRVLRPGGMIMVLEFSRPSGFPLKQIYGLYFRRILPRIGRSVSGDPGAYTYLPDSVMSFPDNERFLELMLHGGFHGCETDKADRRDSQYLLRFQACEFR